MGKNWDKFVLLMWKNVMLQWRHPFQTVVEILAPILFTSLLVVLRALVEPTDHPAAFYLPFEARLPSRAGISSVLAWSPSNIHLERIMDDTVEALSAKNNFTMSHTAFGNSDELNQFLSNEFNLYLVFAGVVFDNALANAEELSPVMNVTIRFSGEQRAASGLNVSLDSWDTWRTNRLFAGYDISGPRYEQLNEGGIPSYSTEGFLALQQEISLSIIKHFKEAQGQRFNRNDTPIYMQRFAYPRWTTDILMNALDTFVGLIFMLSFVYTCISNVKIITTEKEKQLKEAMKIMGLPNWLHWTAWFVKCFVFLLISIVIMIILLKAQWYPHTEFTIFTLSDPLVLFLFLMLFMCSTITLCFAISVFFMKANTAATMAGLMWFLSYFPYTLLREIDISLTEKVASSLASNTAMAWGFEVILAYEAGGEGVQWYNLFEPATPESEDTLGYYMLMLILDSLIYLAIALYVEAVFPGEYGVPQKWYFIFTYSYWCGKPKQVDETVDESTTAEDELFEREPTHLDAGIRINNLRKKFGKKFSVRDLTMNMYKDQITVLLGHNGAGKTTTMCMLTGMFPPSSGTAYVGGYDICTDMSGVRESLGLCPQHNILFDELTVREHLYFYSRLKGISKAEVEGEIKKYIELLELVPKANAQSSTLSGGMKRKLSVGVALCGDSKVVMCDEPTAGMDPSARRALWDLLQEQKKGRTILLTTHFMDEADLLGDRIAIMAGGKLQCCGSSFFLKKKYGAGYHLIMDKSPQCDISKVTDLLQRHIPNIKVESNVGSELTYLLNEEHSHVFEEMLGDLETGSSNLGVNSYGISLTTLEEVFLKVGADHGQEEINDAREEAAAGLANGFVAVDTTNGSLKHMNGSNGNLNGSTPNGMNRYSSEVKLNMEKHLLTGWALWRNQLLAMFMKRGLSIYRTWILFVIQNLIPVLFLILSTIIFRQASGGITQLPRRLMTLDSYEDSVTVMTRAINSSYSERYVDFLSDDGKEYINWGDDNFDLRIIEETENDVKAVRQSYIAGASFQQDRSIIAWFNNVPYHSAPLSLQMVMNSMLHQEVSSSHYIQIFNHPLPYSVNTQFSRLTRGTTVGFQIAFNVGFSMAFVSSFYIMFYVRERVSKSKHLQFVSGIDVIPYWLTSFICDLLTFSFTALCSVFTMAALQEEGFSTFVELGRVLLALLSFGFSMLPMMYLASYFFDIPSTGYTKMTLINIFTGVAAFLIVQVLTTPELDLGGMSEMLHWIFLLVPHYALSSGVSELNMMYSVNAVCDTAIDTCVNLNVTQLPPLNEAQCKFLICIVQSRCCTMTDDYFDIEAPGIGRNLLFSFSIALILIAIVLVVEYRFFEEIIYMLRKEQAPPDAKTDEDVDEDVLREKEKIHGASVEEIKNTNLVMRDVAKYYGKFLAVNNLCLGINRSECFGLLGVNGAGKTTTFKMMTGDIRISSGDAWVNGMNLKTSMKKINQLIGYCPQFDALLDDLTARETLLIFGLLRGITLSDSKLMAIELAKDFDFYRHLDKKVKELSGGNKRKLSTAVALIGDPLVLYLDEPTTGMDPATKRYLWNCLCKVRDSGKCIVLTSHSMEECEALCTRLAIMVNGALMCLGSTQHLKNKFSNGYTLTVKIKGSNDDEVHNAEVESIEKFVTENFRGAAIREKHRDLITFYIADKTQSWSKMFGIMERGKKCLSIEDYSLGQCSLEQVFLTFAKQQREE